MQEGSATQCDGVALKCRDPTGTRRDRTGWSLSPNSNFVLAIASLLKVLSLTMISYADCHQVLLVALLYPQTNLLRRASGRMFVSSTCSSSRSAKGMKSLTTSAFRGGRILPCPDAADIGSFTHTLSVRKLHTRIAIARALLLDDLGVCAISRSHL